MSVNVAIDIGNTSTKIGVFSQKDLIQVHRLKNEEIANNTQLLFSFDAEHYILSSVNKPIETEMKIEQLEEKLLRLLPGMPLPVKLNYQSPETLGKDRIAVAVAIAALFPKQNSLAIDAGSCVTYDIITKNGVYLGGGISPGIQMRLKALHQYTDQLPLLFWDTENIPQKVGSSTITSILSGVVNGMIAEINGIIESYQKQFSNLKVVITGGDSIFFEKALKNSIFADPNLVLKGLNEILLYHHR